MVTETIQEESVELIDIQPVPATNVEENNVATAEEVTLSLPEPASDDLAPVVIALEEVELSPDNVVQSDDIPPVSSEYPELFLALSEVLTVPVDQVSTVLCSAYAALVLLLVLLVASYSSPQSKSSQKINSKPQTALGSVLFHSDAPSSSSPSSLRVVVHHYDPAASSKASACDLLSSVDDQAESECGSVAAQWPQPGEASSSDIIDEPSSGSVVVQDTEVQAEDPLLTILQDYLHASGKTMSKEESDDVEGSLPTILQELVAENLQLRSQGEKIHQNLVVEQQRNSNVTDNSMRLASQLGQVSEQLQRTQSRLAAKEEHQRWMQGNHLPTYTLNIWKY